MGTKFYVQIWTFPYFFLNFSLFLQSQFEHDTLLYAGWKIYWQGSYPSRVFSHWDSGERFVFLQVWTTLHAPSPFGTHSQIGLSPWCLRAGELTFTKIAQRSFSLIWFFIKYIDEPVHPFFGPIERLRIRRQIGARIANIWKRGPESNSKRWIGLAPSRRKFKSVLYLIQNSIRHRSTCRCQMFQSRCDGLLQIFFY